MSVSNYSRRFVPGDFDAGNAVQVKAAYRSLIDRPIGSAGDLRDLLVDFSELHSVIDEFGTRRYIDRSCHTDDETIKQRFMHYVEEIEPLTKPLYFEMQKKVLGSSFAAEFKEGRLGMLVKKWRAEVEIFRPENVAIDTQVTKLVTDYDSINGDMLVTYQGKEQTLQQMGKYLETPDRRVREETWRLTGDRRLVDQEKMEDIFDQILELRGKIATNAGLKSYRDYCWKQYKRFDYTPEMCLGFAEAIEKTVVPLVRELDESRTRELGVETLRPWDLNVDPKNRPALEPYDSANIEGLIEKTQEIFAKLSPALGKDFASLRTNNNLDLESRKGKQPGGYQSTLEEVRQPFIFMNAAGLQRDVEVLLHEGGHAFHSIAAANEELVFLRSAPMEFCEVASMSMELLGAEHFDVFYDSERAGRAKRSLLEGIIKFLPWIAVVDGFQHWLYAHPGHRRADRQATWLSLLERFMNKADWSGLEKYREKSWQKQLHLYHVPFYYIEYGIAQLGALQLWVKSQQDQHKALANYRAALALGGTRSLPELFASAGIVFDFSQKTLGPLMDAIAEEMGRLPR